MVISFINAVLSVDNSLKSTGIGCEIDKSECSNKNVVRKMFKRKFDKRRKKLVQCHVLGPKNEVQKPNSVFKLYAR